MKIFPHLFASLLLLLPALVSADSYSSLTFEGLVAKFVAIVNQIIPVLISLAVFLLMIGIFRYITSAGDSKTHQDGINLVLYGVLGIFVMASVWGLINLGVSILGLGGGRSGGIAP